MRRDLVTRIFGGRRPRRRPVAQGRAMSNGCTFAPPAIRGFDGSMCSCRSRFWTSARDNKGVLQAFSLPECDVEKCIAEIGPPGLIPAAKRLMVGIGRGDYQHIGVRETRDKDSGIAGRDDHYLVSRARPRQHVGEFRRRERLREPPGFDCKAGGRAMRGENQKQNVVLGVHSIGCRLQ